MPQIEEAQPKYLQIAHYIRDQILRGDLRPGDEVPSERQLAADWKVSRPTAARSLEALSHQGLVEKQRCSRRLGDTPIPGVLLHPVLHR